MSWATQHGGRAALAAPACEPLRVRVAAVLVLDEHLVLVRHRKGDSSYHLLPGGGVETGETLQAALVREVSEETGLTIDVGRPLFINDTVDPRGGRNLLNVTFLATVTGGQVTDRPADPRVEAVDLVAAADLPSLDLRPPIAAELAAAYESGFTNETRYLGSLWVDDSGTATASDTGT